MHRVFPFLIVMTEVATPLEPKFPLPFCSTYAEYLRNFAQLCDKYDYDKVLWGSKPIGVHTPLSWKDWRTQRRAEQLDWGHMRDYIPGFTESQFTDEEEWSPQPQAKCRVNFYHKIMDLFRSK